ncbi:ubiquitin-related domain-containing protein [Mycena leptocephala]|nr:ubiquitin-related domain-containing protein [Mycena leptocephala]KAJ7915673.1 ubiquitin-related domain-containing protein [Mycena leptocephala]
MSQEPEDVKPKLNLNITYEGNQITVKVKPNTKFTKIFQAAEQKFGKDAGTFKFVYDGTRIGKDDTPADLGIEDGDQIDCFLEQVGGSWTRS